MPVLPPERPPATAGLTLSDLLTEAARQATTPRLARLAGTAGALAASAFALGVWPLGLALVCLTAAAGWALADRAEVELGAAGPDSAPARRRLLRQAKFAASLVGWAAAFGLLLGATFWLSGPAPTF